VRTHQADNFAKLWFEFLSVSELIAQILCAVSDCENKYGVKQKTLFVAFTATPFEQWLAALRLVFRLRISTFRV